MLLAVWFIISQIGISTIVAECIVSINKDLTDPQPLLINVVDDTEDIFPSPSRASDKIFFKENKIIQIYCPGSVVIVKGKQTATNSTNLKCIDGKFLAENKPVPFSSITCSKQAKSSARYTGNVCNKKYKEFEIGFKYNNRFLTLITGCFDDMKLSTIYTKSKISKNIIGHQLVTPRPNWSQGSFYNLNNVNNLFTRNHQRLIINNDIGLNNLSTKYISEFDDFYLSRGHLSPKADFLYGSQQKATFYLINAVPQWHTLNRGNWKILENNIRQLATKRELDLIVYTGIHDILSIPHESTGKQIKLYLYTNGKTKKIPVPKYLWKIVYDPKSKMGVAFIGLNNPYVEDLKKYKICENICDKLNYLRLSKNNLKNGYVFCCAIDNLRKKVDSIPIFDVSDLLV